MLLPLITSEHLIEVIEIVDAVKNVLTVAIWGAAWF